MKVKTSITLSETLITALDAFRDNHTSRSELIETIVEEYVTRRQREKRDERDLTILNANAEFLNSESQDFEDLQAW